MNLLIEAGANVDLPTNVSFRGRWTRNNTYECEDIQGTSYVHSLLWLVRIVHSCMLSMCAECLFFIMISRTWLSSTHLSNYIPVCYSTIMPTCFLQRLHKRLFACSEPIIMLSSIMPSSALTCSWIQKCNSNRDLRWDDNAVRTRSRKYYNLSHYTIKEQG